mmetsp:Transcript_135300/g.269945  ORF Transcript_135300/g.269945 Transcript_135300/m.269945 type:complete len:202 (-) Transcript_135300:683-1288(-)
MHGMWHTFTEPQRAKPRTARDAPRRKKSSTDNEEPKRDTLRTAKELPNRVKSMAEREKSDPSRATPSVASDELQRNKPRNEKIAPRCRKSSNDNDAPDLAIPSCANDELQRARPRNAKDAPKQEKCSTDSEEPKRASLRTAKELPNWLKSMADSENSDPNRTIPNSAIDEKTMHQDVQFRIAPMSRHRAPSPATLRMLQGG